MRYNADSTSGGYGNLYFITVKVNADDIERDERFATVQFKFREEIRPELGKTGKLGGQRDYLRK